MKKLLIALLVALLLCISVSAHAVVTAYSRTALTGGGATALDGITGMADNDFAFVMASSVAYFYMYDAESVADEASPTVIAPDTGTGRWLLQTHYYPGLTIGAAGSIDIAASAVLNLDTNLTVQTGAVTLTGNAAGSTLVLPSGSTTIGAIAAAGDVVVGSGAGVTTVITKGANNSIFGVSSAGTLGFNTAISMDNSAAQFYDTAAPTKYMKIDPSGMTATKTATIAGACADDCTITLPDATATLLATNGDGSSLTGVVPADASVTAAKLAAVAKTEGATVSIGDATNPVATGVHWSSAFRVPMKCTLTKVILTTSQASGAITIDVFKDAAGAATGLAALTVADSIFSVATKPAIADASADAYVEVTAFDSGEEAVAAGSWFVVNVDSATTVTLAHISFEFTRVD